MASGNGCLIGLILFISASVMCLGFGIASVSLHTDPTCGVANGILTSFNQWVWVSGGTYITLGILYIVGAVLFIADIPIFGLVIVPLGGGFLIAWTVVEGVILFGSGVDCKTLSPHLWSLGLGMFISYVIYLPAYIFLAFLTVMNV